MGKVSHEVHILGTDPEVAAEEESMLVIHFAGQAQLMPVGWTLIRKLSPELRVALLPNRRGRARQRTGRVGTLHWSGLYFQVWA